MIGETTAVVQGLGQPEKVVTPSARPSWWSRLALGAIMLISIFMNFYQLGQNGFGNTYYAAGVRSMLDNWHNFFFVSYDPGGFVTIDKPPLGFWLQVASARIFGFTPFSVFLPQALAGVISVLLLYWLVRRHFGIVAGLLAALALALSPISVVTARNNTIDMTLVLVMLLAAWTTLRAAETGKLRWLLLTAVLIGLGFNIKMAEAYLVVPALALLYLLAAPKNWRVRILHLLLAGLVMVVISFSWITAVDLTPASQRPYVGSTQDNSELSLAIGYNGIERLIGGVLGGFGRRGDARPNFSTSGITRTTNGQSTGTGQNTPITGNGTGQFPPFSGAGTTADRTGSLPERFRGTGGFGGGAGGMFGTGTPGPLRLFNAALGGQISWLLPLALLSILALAWQSRLNFQENRRQQSLVLWGMWLLTTAIFFSVASFIHQYYLVTMAPAIAALFGIGLVVMWQDYRRPGWRGWLLPIALLATAAEQIHIISSDPAWGSWLIPVIAGLTILAALILIVVRLLPRVKLPTVFPMVGLCAGILAVMLVPAIWSAIPALNGITQNLPSAGPSGGFGSGFVAGNFGGITSTGRARDFAVGGFGGPGNATADTALIAYLEAHQGNTKFLVAVPSSMVADSIILATNKPVMAMGGFSGSDPILTVSSLKLLINDGTVHYFLLGGGGFGGGQSAVTSWITQSCQVVPSSQWQSSSTTSSGGSFGGFREASTLYYCASAK